MTRRCRDCQACDTCAEIEAAERDCEEKREAIDEATDAYNAACRHLELVLAQAKAEGHGR